MSDQISGVAQTLMSTKGILFWPLQNKIFAFKILLLSLSLNGHLYKMNTSLKWTSKVGPALPLSFELTLCKTDITLKTNR